MPKQVITLKIELEFAKSEFAKRVVRNVILKVYVKNAMRLKDSCGMGSESVSASLDPGLVWRQMRKSVFAAEDFGSRIRTVKNIAGNVTLGADFAREQINAQHVLGVRDG